MKWVEYRPKAKMHVLAQDLPRRHPDPRLLLRQEHRPPADGEVPHLHDDHRRDEERVRRPARDASGTTRTRGSTDARRSARHPEGDPLRALRDHGRHDRGQRPRAAHDVPGHQGLHARERDQVAIDAVAAKMMGFDPMTLEYIKVAHDDGLGVGDPRDIEIVGDDISNESWGFTVGDNGASMVGDFMWFGPMKRFQKLFFHTPLVNVVHLRERGLPRLLPLAAEGQEDLREVEARDDVGPALRRLRARRGRPRDAPAHGHVERRAGPAERRVRYPGRRDEDPPADAA